MNEVLNTGVQHVPIIKIDYIFRNFSAKGKPCYGRANIRGVNRRRLLKDRRDSLFLVPLYRQHFSDDPGQDVLCRVKNMCVPLRVKSLFYRLLPGTLPVKTWMNDKGRLPLELRTGGTDSIPTLMTDGHCLCRSVVRRSIPT